MSNAPQLSISIVNTNNCSLLRDCLTSIYQNTTRTSFETIVIDNYSTDSSVEMLKQEFPSVRVILNQKREGYGFSHNKGIEAARGEYILIFNEDMLILNDALDRMVEIIKRNPKIGALGCRLLNADGTLQHSCFRFQSLKRKLFEEIFPRNILFPNSRKRGKMFEWDHDGDKEVDIIMGCCMLVPKRVLDKVGIFDPSFFVYSEEDDLCKRIRNNGYNVFFTNQAQIIHLGGQTSKTMSTRMHLIQIDSKIKYFRKHHGLLQARIARLLTGIGAVIRYAGWSGYWVLRYSSRQQAKSKMVLYLKVLQLSLGLRKPV